MAFISLGIQLVDHVRFLPIGSVSTIRLGATWGQALGLPSTPWDEGCVVLLFGCV